MNKKGFTLIELLAVIVMIIIIVGLGAPTLINVLKNNKEKAQTKTIEIIESAARSYAIDYGESAGNIICISTLCSKEYLSCPINNIVTEIVMDGCVIVTTDANNIKNYNYDSNITDSTIVNLTIDLDGGSIEIDPTDSYYVGSNITLSTPTKPNSTFAGWNIESGNSTISGNNITIGTVNTKLKAMWSTSILEITYNCNGGSGSTLNSIYTHGSTSVISKNGCYKAITAGSNGMIYYLKGWAKTNNATTPLFTDEQDITNTSEITANTTLYAVWGNLFSLTGNYEIIDDSNGNWRIKIKGSVGNTSGNASIIFNKDTKIDAFLVGGGGSGGNSAGGGGGGGYFNTITGLALKMATSYPIVIGAGGAAQTTVQKDGNDGESTTFATYTVDGGKGGLQNYTSTNRNNGGAGGSGGGGGGGGTGGAGGSNGSNGVKGSFFDPYGWGAGGLGTGTETHEFFEASGTLYAGGGGGCAGTTTNSGAGGEGGGGAGSSTSTSAGSGTANTGGGGGGGDSASKPSGAGGSGIVVIRNVVLGN